MDTIQSKIPTIYHSFFPDFKNLPIPKEEIATCNDCTMCQSSKSAFLNTKCCAYFPRIPNYLIGGILSDTRPELQSGKDRIKDRINNKVGVVPYGIITPVSYSTRMHKLKKKKENNWTRHEAESVLCPYYHEGQCTVWDYRENCCSTHFCYSVGGKFGQHFWKTLNQYLILIENELSKYAAFNLNLNPEQIHLKSTSTIDYGIEDEFEKLNLEKYNKIWEHWAGREEEFYIESYKIIKDISATDFLKIGGVNQQILHARLINAYQSFINTPIPDHLVLSPKAKMKVYKNNLIEYSTELGAIKVSEIVSKFIALFDGQTKTLDVCQTANMFIPNFQDTYLQRLYHLEILIPTK